MTIPTIPDLPAGYVVQLADLQNLAAAVTFALTKPAVYVVDNTGGQAITTNFAAASFTTAIIQTDNLMFQGGSPHRLHAQTPGWYKVSYGVNVGSVGGVFNSAVRSTTGPNNPQGSGVNSNYYWGGYTDVAASSIGYAGATGDWPFYLYQGDYLEVHIKAAAAGASTGTAGIDGGNNAGSFFALELVSI
jgi:hypothetical protein